MEYTTTFRGEVIEVLGYGFDVLKMNELMKGRVLTFEEKQKGEYKLIYDQYKRVGVTFDESNNEFKPFTF